MAKVSAKLPRNLEYDLIPCQCQEITNFTSTHIHEDTVVWKLKRQLVLEMARAKNTLFIFYFQYFLWVLKLHIPLQNVRHH